MYLSFISMLRSPKQRAAFKGVITGVSATTQKSKASICADVLFSGFAYGSTAQEYENLKFYSRSHENRKTFITSYYNLRNYNRLNNRTDREIFRDKVRFNQTFAEFIGRDWILINKEQPEQVFDFIGEHGSAIIKPRFGDSGKDIFFLEKGDYSTDEMQKVIIDHDGFLAEEVLTNHEDIRVLNPSSLNTVRIITIVTKDGVEFLYSGIRIGAPDAKVDNISMGGKVAVIDLDTGVIEGGFQSKTTSEVRFDAGNYSGKAIPQWAELKKFVQKAALVVPGVRYIAWDVAITPKGPALIEGNHSSGNTITQASISIDSPGLRPRLEEILKKC